MLDQQEQKSNTTTLEENTNTKERIDTPEWIHIEKKSYAKE